jgi:protein-arginine kinase
MSMLAVILVSSRPLGDRPQPQSFLLTQPAHLQLKYGENLNAEQRDVLRAQMLREKLN